MAKKEVEMNLDMFLVTIEDWDGKSPAFDEVFRTALLHAALMGRGEEFVAILAEKLEASKPTIRRYARGISRPRPRIMKYLVKEVSPILIALREEVRKAERDTAAWIRSIGR